MENKVFHPTAQGLVELVKACKKVPHIYVWDGNGQYVTCSTHATDITHLVGGIHCADLTTLRYEHLDTDSFPFTEREDINL